MPDRTRKARRDGGTGFLGASLTVALLVPFVACAREPRVHAFDIATTTSVKNSGMLHVLLLAFNGPIVNVHAAGSGQALEMLADGVVDVAVTHAPDAEARHLAEHPDWG